MFTGLVEKTSVVEKFVSDNDGARIFFKADFDDVKIGDSIAINGVCLTVTSIENALISADIMKETLNISNLKNIKVGNIVNLERAMRADSRLDGHIVSGHIDTTSKVTSIKKDGFAIRMRFNCDTSLIIKKGSICINGVSLTVSDVSDNDFEVSLIPATIENTNLKNLKISDIVNIEYDILAKYIQKFCEIKKETKKEQKKEITFEYLRENGF